MYRSPWELDAHVRYSLEHLARERRLCDEFDAAGAAPPRQLAEIRQRIGIALIQIGAAIAGSDALRALAVRQPEPATAHR